MGKERSTTVMDRKGKRARDCVACRMRSLQGRVNSEVAEIDETR